MAMNISNESLEHPHLQLAASLREQIKRGEIVTQLPSLTVLVARSGLAMGTVRRAVQVLVQEQLVRTVPGRGIFVSR
jgi:DNA-binding GntR family transcriptional regulator